MNTYQQWLMEKNECCGECCWMKFEDIDGYGQCPVNKKRWFCHCSDSACDDYSSQKDKRHYTAVLLQANRYRRDQNVPSIYRMPDPTELGKAIDFAVKYIKTFSKL